MDPSLRHSYLVDNIEKKVFDLDTLIFADWKSSKDPVYFPNTLFDIRTTFNELDGEVLHISNLTFPYKRCLNFHARMARIEGIKQKWFKPEEFDFEDFWSEGMNLKEKIDLLMDKTTIESKELYDDLEDDDFD